MLFWTIIKVALKSLLANKLRSFLAMLGIIIGVGAVIAMLAIGTAARKQMLGFVSALGTNLLVVRPGQTSFRGVVSGNAQNLTVDDALAITTIPHVSMVAPVVQGGGQIKFEGKNTRPNLLGSTPTYFTIRSFEVEPNHGRTFNQTELDRQERVAVIGPVTATNLFGDAEPLDQVIKIKGINFRVIGVMKSKGDQGFFNQDDQVIVPLTTAMKQLFGLTFVREIDVNADDEQNLSQIQSGLADLLRKRHRLLAEQDNDFDIRNQAEMLATRMQTVQLFQMLLIGIASISLLVGGIGIMNIMLVTVTERTREIGVRKAIGAKERDIMTQFLLESLLMSGVGALLGSAAGVGAAALIPRLTDNKLPTLIDPFSIVLSVSFAAGVGIVFGLYPAWRASKLDPIDALRYE
jgi:putative ABC transport system permease protein